MSHYSQLRSRCKVKSSRQSLAWLGSAQLATADRVAFILALISASASRYLCVLISDFNKYCTRFKTCVSDLNCCIYYVYCTVISSLKLKKKYSWMPCLLLITHCHSHFIIVRKMLSIEQISYIFLGVSFSVLSMLFSRGFIKLPRYLIYFFIIFYLFYLKILYIYVNIYNCI